MIVELRRNYQVIVPRRIVEDMGLEIGDQFDVVAEDGVIKFVPVVVLPKADAARMGVVAEAAPAPAPEAE